MATTAPVRAEDAYDVLAPAYETITAGYDYSRWLHAIEGIAVAHGLRGRRLLDVACGTGSSFLPLLERGYEVVACDVSPSMLEQARRRVGDRDVDLHTADMRSLPRFGSFDLALCLDDALNHVLSRGDVLRTLRGIARNLAVGGILIFDVNTLAALRAGFSVRWTQEDERRTISWHGLGSADLAPHGTTAARVTVRARRPDVGAQSTVIRERHHPVAQLVAQIEQAGLAPLAVYGQRRGVRLSPSAHELRHDKALFVARREA